MAVQFLQGIDVEGSLDLQSLTANTTSTVALVMNGNTVEKRTLGSNAFNSTTFSTFSGSYADLTNVPTTFTPSAHNQAWSTITNTPTTISGYGITDAFDGAYSSLTGTPTIPTDFVSKANGGTFSGAVTIEQNGDALNLRSTTNAVKPRITFSSDVPDAQIGHIEYSHSNSASYGSGESIVIGVTETDMKILADGKLMYKTGIYSKPTSGTGAGTRKDANWDAAYTHSQSTHFSGSYADLTNVPTSFTPSQHTHAASAITSGTFATARIPNLSASKITSGTLNNNRLPDTISVSIVDASDEMFIDGENVLTELTGFKRYAGSVSSVSSSGYTTAFTVNGGNLASHVRFSVQGTTSNVVVSNLIDLSVNHHQDIMLEALSGVYTQLSVKVISSGNEDFAVQLKTNSSNAVTLYIEVMAYGSESVTFTNSHSYSGTTLEATLPAGKYIKGTGGDNGDLEIGGVFRGDGSGLTSISYNDLDNKPTIPSNTNYYLDGITKSGNTLTFSVNGATNQTYTFGSNAFNSTTIPTNNNQLTNGAGYITGYTETDTLATVTGRGASTSTTVSLAGGVNIVANPLRFQRSSSSQTGQDDNVSVTVDDSNIYFTHNNDADGDASGFNFRYSTGGTTANLLNFSASSLTYKGNTIWHAGNSHNHDDRYYTESESDTRYFRRNAANDVDVRIAASHGRGVKFWDSDSYKIYMSSVGTGGSTGGSVGGTATSDYNMYFKMSGGTNRGFVFKNSGTNVAQIDGNGHITTTGHFYGRSVNGSYSNIYRMGGIYFTWDSDSYGTNTHHSIRSTYGDSYGDDMTINSYHHLRINIDSNNNNTDEKFEIGQNTTGTGNVRFRVLGSGTVYASSDIVAYYNFSDQRLKTDVKPTTDNLEKILKLEPIEYRWKDGGREGKKEIGLIAQEVEKIVPEVVRENKRLSDDDETLYKQVDYEHLVSTLIGAVQEQQKQIDDLKSELANVKYVMCKCK